MGSDFATSNVNFSSQDQLSNSSTNKFPTSNMSQFNRCGLDPSILNSSERVYWLSNAAKDIREISRDKLISWANNHSKVVINACDKGIVRQIMTTKMLIGQLERSILESARNRSNPYSNTGKTIFMNRSATKMANMDAILDFMFTDPKDENEVPLVKDLLYFAIKSARLRWAGHVARMDDNRMPN